MATPAVAAPMLGFVDNMDNTVTLQLTPDPSLLPGAVGIETALTVTGLGIDFTGVAIADPVVWDIPTVGSNPFTGTITTGISANLTDNEIFVSYGSDVLTVPGPTDFLTIGYAGNGTIQAGAFVAQGAMGFEDVSASILVDDVTGPMLPQIQFVDNGDGTVTLQIVNFQQGVIATELAFDTSIEATGDIQFTDATVNESLFDVPLPGDNPFIPGSPIGGDANGLDLSGLLNNQIFAAFAAIPGEGVFDFVTIGYTGTGTINAFGLVAQGNSLNDGLTASITVPEPATLVVAGLALTGLAVRRRRV